MEDTYAKVMRRAHIQGLADSELAMILYSLPTKELIYIKIPIENISHNLRIDFLAVQLVYNEFLKISVSDLDPFHFGQPDPDPLQ